MQNAEWRFAAYRLINIHTADYPNKALTDRLVVALDHEDLAYFTGPLEKVRLGCISSTPLDLLLLGPLVVASKDEMIDCSELW